MFILWYLAISGDEAGGHFSSILMEDMVLKVCFI